jgi:hypothetical protein
MTEVRDTRDVRLRAAVRSDNRALCEKLLWEMDAFWIAGPAGGGGVRGSITTRSIMVDRSLDQTRNTELGLDRGEQIDQIDVTANLLHLVAIGKANMMLELCRGCGCWISAAGWAT